MDERKNHLNRIMRKEIRVSLSVGVSFTTKESNSYTGDVGKSTDPQERRYLPGDLLPDISLHRRAE